MQSQDPAPRLNKQKHIKYWLRCLKTHLPHQYQSTDSQRLSLAFFILSALDLLDELHGKTSEDERKSYVDTIYRHQHGSGGFRANASPIVGEKEEEILVKEDPAKDHGIDDWDTANLASTFFALASLIVLRDDLNRVKGAECLRWLKKLQRDDGSFGEAITNAGVIEGGGDVRFCYLASGVRWILRYDEKHRKEDLGRIEDVDIDGLVDYIVRSTTYEGGIAKAPLHEAHAGETFCGIGALSLLGRLPSGSKNPGQLAHKFPEGAEMPPGFLDKVVRWLLHRQTTLVQEHEEDEGESSESDEPSNPRNMRAASQNPTEFPPKELLCAGFNGRCNKIADTCYSWWVGGTLGILNQSHLQDFHAAERYLLEKTQHFIGGFSKIPGDPPDILHSSLGLAALASIRHPDLKRIDCTLCISQSAMDDFKSRSRGSE